MANSKLKMYYLKLTNAGCGVKCCKGVAVHLHRPSSEIGNYNYTYTGLPRKKLITITLTRLCLENN